MLSTQQSNQQVESTPFCPSRALQRMVSVWTVWDRQVQPALDSRKTDSWRSSGHIWMRMTLVRAYYVDWSHSRWQLQKSLPANRNESSGRCGRRVDTSARLEFTKSKLCSTYAICKLSQHVPAMSVGDVCSRLRSLWSMSPCRMKTAPGLSPWGSVMPQCGTWCLALNSPINKLNQHLFVRAGRCREWCPSGRSEIGRCSQLLTQEKQTPDEVAGTHGWERLLPLISDDSCKKLACKPRQCVKWKMWTQSWLRLPSGCFCHARAEWRQLLDFHHGD